MTAHVLPDQDDDILLDLQQIVLRTLAENGIPAGSEMAGKIIEEVRSSWGGQQIYIKKTDQAQLTERNLEIYSEFNGSNHQWLAKKYNLAVPVIYRIVKVVQQAERDKRQHKLFGSEED